jgi:hypothetical protein
MSYQRKYPTAVGADIREVAKAAAKVMTDPCLYDVTSLVLKLNELESRKAVSSFTPTGATPKFGGVGLCRAVKPLKAVVYARQRPWLLPLVGVAVVGGLVGLGWFIRGSGK